MCEGDTPALRMHNVYLSITNENVFLLFQRFFVMEISLLKNAIFFKYDMTTVWYDII